MQTIIRWSLRALAFLAGMAGAGIAHLRYTLAGRIDDFIVLGAALLLVLVMLMRGRLREGTSVCLVFLVAGSMVILGAIAYGRTLGSLVMLGMALFGGVFLANGGLRTPIRRVISYGIIVVMCQWCILGADHLVFGGRIVAFRRQMDYPIFFSFEPLQVERTGSHAIYLFEISRCMWVNYEAMIWGWSAFPKAVDLGDARPTGLLIDHPRIEEAIR